MFDSAVLLVADTDDQQRSFLANQLTADDATVHTGCDRAQTLARAAVHGPAALVLGDLDPPGTSVELIRTVRASSGLPTEPSPDLPVIALVDSTDQLAVLRAFHAGADDVADRATDYAVLRARLLVLLGRAGSRACAPTVKVGALEVSHAQRRAWLHGEPLDLSRKEVGLTPARVPAPGRRVLAGKKRQQLGSRPQGDLRSRPDTPRTDPHRPVVRRGPGVGGARPR